MTFTLHTRGSHVRHAADGHRLIGLGSAHAKVILFGEHAVMFGAPAIALPLPQLETHAELRATPGEPSRIESALYAGEAAGAPEALRPVTAALENSLLVAGLYPRSFDLRIRSSIPHSRGLGSSAAVAAAIARAAAAAGNVHLKPGLLFSVVQQSEQIAHGRPSGVDARAVAATGPIRFQDGVGDRMSIGRRFHFVIADSGLPASTAQAVGLVAARRRQEGERIESLLFHLGDLAEGAATELASGDQDALGERMSEAHTALARIGVSTACIDALATTALGAGALGAKLTGGGLGGCLLVLARDPESATRIARKLRAAGAVRTWQATVSDE
ncbi:mevalonate kinase [Leucobacter luti]|uniref:mevalonate kinase n=1 Tax=Leucobacter luti TaxID=340320 RepID=UPI003D0462AB